MAISESSSLQAKHGNEFIFRSPSSAAKSCVETVKKPDEATERLTGVAFPIIRGKPIRNGDGEHFALLAYGETPEQLLACIETRARSQAGR